MCYKHELARYKGIVEEKLFAIVDGCGAPKELKSAMRYSLEAGGKRLRPAMTLYVCEMLDGDIRRALPFACALEMIHTYSLIHDDLPCMDNDDYRRGMPSNHKVFGDGMAILAGDGLLTLAFEVLLSQPDSPPATLNRFAREVAAAAGPAGMVGGQAIDLSSEGKFPSPQTMALMHSLKTGALFRASIRSGAILAEATESELASLTRFAEKFGLAFQITDDILDVTGSDATLGKPVGSDERNQKATYVTVYSLPEAQKMAQQAVAEAVASLEQFGEKAWVLRSLAEYLLTRDN